jgi:hypothetical protein
MTDNQARIVRVVASGPVMVQGPVRGLADLAAVTRAIRGC